MSRLRKRIAAIPRPFALFPLAGLAVLGVASASDRVATRGDHHGVLGSLAFGPGVLRNRARLALENGNPDDGARFAREAVASAPGDQYALALLASSELALGAAADADATFRVAAQLGWRDPTTQRYWALTSMSGDAYDLAAQRIDALLRSGASVANDQVLVTQLLSTDQGRAAFVERMMLRPGWLDEFVKQAGTAEGQGLSDRLSTVEAARAKGIAFDPETVASTGAALVKRGEYAAAMRLTRSGSANTGTATLLTDGDFERWQATDPFDWQLESSGAASVELATAPAQLSGKAISVSPIGAGTATVLKRVLVLPPGSYTLGWQTAGLAEGSDFALALRCAPSMAPIEIKPVVDGANNRRTFAVPAGADCPSQSLRILLSASVGQRGTTAWIDNVILEKAD